MFESSEQRIKLLKAGFSGKEIERLYIKYNNFKIVYFPILYEISEFNEVNMKVKNLMQNANSASSLDLERAGLCQPETSIAMRQLKERDWISEREKKKALKVKNHQ